MSFFESIALDAAESTGFWTTKARFARAGIQEYRRHECAGWPGIDSVTGQTVRVYRPESVVFDQGSMDSFARVPITVEHEDGFVTTDNARGVIVGAAGYPVTREGDSLVVPVTIYDGAAIHDAQSGERRQLSAGYDIDVQYAPGECEYGAYDYVMTSWRGNHITITRAGKAGPQYYLGDTMAEKTAAEAVERCVTRVVDGISYPLTEQGAQILDRVLGERDAARAELTKVRAQILDEAEIERRVNDRVSVVESAKRIAKDVDFAGKSTDAIVLETVAVAYDGIDLSDKSTDYVRALFDSADMAAGKTQKSNDRAMAGTANDSASESPYLVARARFIAEHSGRR